MKRNWTQSVSLAINAALLLLVLGQGGRLGQLEASVRDAASNIAALNQEIERLHDQVGTVRTQLREGERLISDYTLEPAGLDVENRALLADVALQLKQWRADSAVDLTVSMGGKETVQGLGVDETGACRGQIAIPLEGETEMALAAQITSGGITTYEDLGTWHGVAALLSLRQGGTSVSGPKYLGGVLTGQVDICIETDGQAQVVDPVFRVYLNGKLAEELPAELSRSSSSTAGDCYAPATPEQKLEVECSLGDTVAVTFFCRDSFGLGYEFAVANWTASVGGASTPEPYAPGANPVLTWPE